MWFRKKGARKTKPSGRRVLVRQCAVGFGLAILVGLLGYGVYAGSRVSSLTISEVTIVGGTTLNHEAVRQAVWPTLEGSYFSLVPRVFAWTYPEAEVADAVASFERIKQFDIEVVDGTNLTVVFEEYVPVALWCERLDSKSCLFLDRSGYAFTQAPELQGGAFLRFSDVARAPTIGESAFSAEWLTKQQYIVDRAYTDLGLNIVQIERTAPEEIVFYISGGGLVKTAETDSGDKIIDTLALILQSEDFIHLEPGNFDYIDLRFGNKVFVHEGVEEAASSTASTSSSTTEI